MQNVISKLYSAELRWNYAITSAARIYVSKEHPSLALERGKEQGVEERI